MADADALREAGVPSRLPANPDTAVTPPGSAPLTPAPAAAPPAEEKVMTLVDHLTELRNRIFISLIAVAIGAAIGFYYSTDIIHLLKSPLPPDPTTGLPRALNFLA